MPWHRVSGTRLGAARARGLTPSLGPEAAAVNARQQISRMACRVPYGFPQISVAHFQSPALALLLDLLQSYDQRIKRMRSDDGLLACLGLREFGSDHRCRVVRSDAEGASETVHREGVVSGAVPGDCGRRASARLVRELDHCTAP